MSTVTVARPLVLLLVTLVALCSSDDFLRHEPRCQALHMPPPEDMMNNTAGSIEPALEAWQGIVLLLSLGAFFTFMAIIHRLVRTYVFYDGHLLDTYFDAGGDVNFALLAAVIVAQWTFTSTFSWSSLATVQFGIAGQFWFAAGTTVQLLLFAVVACEVRIKAPGAKTFLQVVHARFGRAAHIIIMIYALITIIVVVGLVLTEGAHLMASLVNGVSFEVIVIIVSIVVAIYTVIGGLGGIAHAAYTACLVFFGVVLYLLILFIYQQPDDIMMEQDFGSVERVYNVVSCVNTIAPNEQNSLLTFISLDGLILGVMVILSSFPVVFVDQSFWQCSMAAKPMHSVWGYLIAAVCFFALPLCSGYVFGFGYWLSNIHMGNHTLSPDEEMRGFIPVVVVQQLLPVQTGSFIMFTLLMVGVVTTLSNEVLAVSSVIIYDIYQAYIAPFHSPLTADSAVSAAQSAQRTEQYLKYDRRSTIIKHVTVIAASALMIPVALVVNVLGVDMQWLLMALGVLVGSCVGPVTLTITWHRITRAGFIIGCVGGMVCGLVAWLVYASMFPGGLGDFFVNTSMPTVMLTGLAASLIMGTLLCIVISLPCGGCDPTRSEEEQWEYTRLIDNPILPWQVKYATEVGSHDSYKGRPHFYTVRRAFRAAEVVAYVIGALLALGLVLIWPAFMLTAGVLQLPAFESWSMMVLVWTAVGGGLLALLPLVIELFQICRQSYYNRDWKRLEQNNPSLAPRTVSAVGIAGRSTPQTVVIDTHHKHEHKPSHDSVRRHQRSQSYVQTIVEPAPNKGHVRRNSDTHVFPASSVNPPHMETSGTSYRQVTMPGAITTSYTVPTTSYREVTVPATSYREVIVPSAYVTRTDILRAVDYNNVMALSAQRDYNLGPSTLDYNTQSGGDGGPQRWKTFIRLE